MLVLVTVRESVSVGVMEQRVVTIAPWEPLRTNSKVLIFDKRWSLVGMVLMVQVTVHGAETNCRECDEESQILPSFEASYNRTARYVTHLTCIMYEEKNSLK
jgi:hypothetical protein